MLNSLGWAALAVAAMLAALHSGAWGVSIAALLAMGAALLLLTHAAVASPLAAGAKASNRRVRMLPERGEPLEIGRRITTFLLVAIVSALICTAIALGMRGLTLLIGGAEADANVIALAAMPLAWTILSYALLMKEARTAQLRLLVIWATVGALGIALELIA